MPGSLVGVRELVLIALVRAACGSEVAVLVSVVVVAARDAGGSFSLIGASACSLIGLIAWAMGVAVRRSDAFFTLLVQHTETQRRLRGLPPAGEASYAADRDKVARGLILLGVAVDFSVVTWVLFDVVSV